MDTTDKPAAATTTEAEPKPMVDVPPLVNKEAKAALLGRIHDIRDFASTDETRFIIGGLHYDPARGFIEATNGRMLIRVPVTAPADEFAPVADKGVAADVIIPVAPFKKALANVPKNGPAPIQRHIRLSVAGIPGMQRVTMTTSDLDTEQVVSAKAIEGVYPNTEQVIPNAEPDLTICLAPNILEPIIDYCKKNGGERHQSIKFGFYKDEHTPCTFEITVPTETDDLVVAKGVFMRMRMS